MSAKPQQCQGNIPDKSLVELQSFWPWALGGLCWLSTGWLCPWVSQISPFCCLLCLFLCHCAFGIPTRCQCLSSVVAQCKQLQLLQHLSAIPGLPLEQTCSSLHWEGLDPTIAQFNGPAPPRGCILARSCSCRCPSLPLQLPVHGYLIFQR